MTRQRRVAIAILFAALPLSVGAWIGGKASANGPVRIAIDAGADRHAISPLIYGSSFASPEAARDLKLALDRSGGNSASLYDWRTEARGAGRDWFFESLPIAADDAAQYGARFVVEAKAGGAEPIVTVPMTGWAATLAADGGKRAAFSVARYGPQAAVDRAGLPDAGNGVRPDGRPITGNDPHDAAHPVPITDTRAWIRGLVARFGPAAQGGIRYYAMDNETTRWHDIHRDVLPVGLHAREQLQRTIAYARMVKSVDPTARIMAPEAWGWGEYRYSGFDQQWGDAKGYDALPDRTSQTGGMDLLPWLLTGWRAAGFPVDVVSVHFYPQGGEFRGDGHDDVSSAMQALRNRSTRLLWDRSYRDTNWIADTVALIPRLRDWVSTYYRAGTPVAITEYDWGAAQHMNGATAQADVLGIFGREGLAMAARWMTPPTGSPAYLAMKLFRNADGRGAGFGETSVATRAPDPDTVAAFGALRASDGALTVVAINKTMADAKAVSLTLARFAAHGRVTGMRVIDGRLVPLPPSRFAGGTLDVQLPAQSITLFEMHPDDR
ncbi:hypothetical protein FHT00_000071 [Sphingomonas insulae]|uniref:Glycoside hydrolase family 44 catalytic domain-containing protein n=1 Tax=Sphingomonas insulae TaxID=424800 RepID=A0ABN1HTH9_9SPHN|nr:glycoside hydrolase family 44 protein [Sphingomonas insulae]NIJ28143.1 hypothetical protein [Sphingomonas insulae]